jgi:Flp pilus assembly protein TadD
MANSSNPDQSAAAWREILRQQPENAEALMHLGLSTLRTGAIAEAERFFARMTRVAPSAPQSFNGHGIALAGLGRLDEALVSFDRALTLDPRDADSWANRGLALTDMSRLDDALDSFSRALALRPDFPAVHKNAGLALHRMRRFHDAIARFGQAIAADPNDAYAHFNQSLSLLALGEYERGWREYEWRWRSSLAHVMPNFAVPVWRNDSHPPPETILVHAEQGLGDSLQFCRYLPMLAAIARIVLVVPEPLTRLMARSYSDIAILRPGQDAPRVDAWVPMMSLPLAFRTTIATIPVTIPYLRADPEPSAAWRQRLNTLPGRKVGLVWSGSPRPDDLTSHLIDQRRSMTLQQCAPLGPVPGVTLISLQKGPAAAQARTPPAGMVLHDWADELDDFADTAALIEALDLVIAVDTSVAHLAGALGKPVWVLNRYDQCWRWLHDRTDSPWYPSARLFRQTSPGDWTGVVTSVAAALTP